MWKTPAWIALVVAVLPATAAAQDARSVVDAASSAIGIAGLKAIAISGAAAEGNFGQSRTISFGLASTPISNYTFTIDFDLSAGRMTGVTPRGAVDRTITALSPWPEQYQLWVTPWGFLYGAAANGATFKKQKIEGVEYRVVTWSPPLRAPSGQPYRVVGYINADDLIDRVETWVDHPIFGDMHVELRYSDYRNFGGVGAPVRTARRCVGMEDFVAVLSAVRLNPPDVAKTLSAPAAAVPRVEPAGPVSSEKIADGVYLITGGYESLAVEFRDHVIVVEAGESEARGLAILAETKRLFPGKRIKYVVTTHPHFDHAAGLPPFAAEGITILIDDPSRYFLEQSLRSPRTLVGDALAKSRRKASVESVMERMVLSDGMRTLELHHVPKHAHSDAMLVAYLPKERILFSADLEDQDVKPLGLEFDRHITVHPRQ